MGTPEQSPRIKVLEGPNKKDHPKISVRQMCLDLLNKNKIVNKEIIEERQKRLKTKISVGGKSNKYKKNQ